MIENEQKWLEKARDVLESNIGRIDAETQSKLTRIRNQALEHKAGRKPYLYGLPVAALATACLVLAIVVNMPEQQSQQEELLDDLDLITTSESLDLIEELEFYEWLEDYDIPT